MVDLIYGGNKYIKVLSELFPNAEISDASDEVHEDRISIEVKIEDEKEYLRIIILNGFLKLSLAALLWVQDPEKRGEVTALMDKWEEEYPEYFI